MSPLGLAGSMASNGSQSPLGSTIARVLTLAGLAVLVVAGLATPGAAQSQTDTVNIDPGSHAAVEIDFTDGPTKDVSYDVEVQEGPNIDVMVLDNANYQQYRDGESFSYVDAWSDLDTGNTDTEFRLEERGTWWVVLDHTGQPDEGTQPATVGAESVTARYTVEAKTNVTDAAKDEVSQLPGPGAAVAAGLVGVVAAVLGRRE